MIKEWLETYAPKNKEEAENALREIMQEVALAGLYREGFFEKAAFYGGTALRILYQLDRFSEDLDFSLLEVNPDFSMEPYLEGIRREFDALGMKVSVQEKQKTKKTPIDSAFLKPETIWRELTLDAVSKQEGLNAKPSVKIKLEIDTEPPLHFSTEEKLLLQPFSFMVKTFALPDLFAGKMHALLFRKWQHRVKGRDWYDMEWYIRRKIALHFDHFVARAEDSGDWDPKEDDPLSYFKRLLQEKIDKISFDAVRADVRPFIRDAKKLDIWSRAYFTELTQRIRIV